MVQFSVKVAEYQISRGRFFYFEHPLSAKSWDLKDLIRLRETDGVDSVVVHMCSFGLGSWDKQGWGLAMKPTRILTNMPSIASSLNRRCTGDHRHVHLMSGRAKAAAAYTEAFCDSIIDGIEVYYAREQEIHLGIVEDLSDDDDTWGATMEEKHGRKLT